MGNEGFQENTDSKEARLIKNIYEKAKEIERDFKFTFSASVWKSLDQNSLSQTEKDKLFPMIMAYSKKVSKETEKEQVFELELLKKEGSIKAAERMSIERQDYLLPEDEQPSGTAFPTEEAAA